MRRLHSRTACTICAHTIRGAHAPGAFFGVHDPAIIANYYDFSADGAQHLLNFLRSLQVRVAPQSSFT
jgi:hypothetical protein